MFPSNPIRMLAVAAALQLCAAASFAQASGVSCQLVNDGAQLQLADGLDDLPAGPLAAPLKRSCDPGSPWPEGTYTAGAGRGVLNVVEVFGSADYHGLSAAQKNAAVVFGDFAPDATGFAMVVHGADKDGNFVKNTKLHILVKAVDGSVVWSKHFLVNDVGYSIGLSSSSPIATVEVKRSTTQPNGIDDSHVVVDTFYTSRYK